MKIKKMSANQNSTINLNCLQTKNYFLYNSKSKNMQSAFIKGLKIIHKYNASNKNIVFINGWPTVTVVAKHLVEKTEHQYLSHIRRLLLNKFDFKHNLSRKKDLLLLLDTKVSGQFKTPSL